MFINRLLRSAFRFARTLRGSIALGMSGFLIIVGLAVGKATAQSTARPISQSAIEQIQVLVQEKRARSQVEQKIASRLLYTFEARRGNQLLRRFPRLNAFVRVDSQGKVRVNLKTNGSVTTEFLEQIKAAGGEILSTVPNFNVVQVRIPLTQIKSIAANPAIRSVNLYIPPQLSSGTVAASREQFATNEPSQTSQAVSNQEQLRSLEAHQPEWRSRLAVLPQIVQQLAAAPGTPITNASSVTSEGDVAHGAKVARSTYAVDGTGVKIGVLSDSYNNLGGANTDIAKGELPAAGVTLVGTGDIPNDSPDYPATDEGRAMLQIIHDLAPGAKLYYATAYSTQENFANNIRALRKAGCDIIVDDVRYFGEAVFQDGTVAQAVNEVTASGALYFSSAGNEGNKSDGTSGVWEGNYVDGGSAPLGLGGKIHKFSNSALFNSLTQDSGPITLQWSDPFGKSANDYDLFVLNSAGTEIIDASTNIQNGDDDPFESVGSQSKGNRVIIVNYNAAPRYLHLNTNRGRLSINTTGQISGHSAAEKAFSVAAVKAQNRTTLFTTTDRVETFSADGVRRIFYKADGTPLKEDENFLSPGGVVRQKADIAAADGVKTTLPSGSGLNPFFGTSAAAPHAAAVAALLKSYKPSLSAAQIRSLLTSTALDIEAKGVDQDSGYGIVMANRVLQKAAQTP